jgi:hypothetical protein
MRATVGGARQSIADVEGQLRQAEGRIEQAIGRGGAAGQKALDDESVLARDYLQSLGAQIAATGRQLDEFAQNDDGTKQATP